MIIRDTMILTFDEAKKRADNPEWFEGYYKRDEICSDEEVKLINDLVKKVGEDKLHEYFAINDDMFLQKEYMDDLIDYLEEFL